MMRNDGCMTAAVNVMPIRFFCGNCRQMLKIGTAKAGSVVECPQCRKHAIVPHETVPEAEELYRLFKESRKNKPVPPKTNSRINGNLLAETVENAEESEFSQWLEEVWSDINVAGSNVAGTNAAGTNIAGKNGLKGAGSNPRPAPLFQPPEQQTAIGSHPVVKSKQQQRTMLLFKVSAGILFLTGILFGAFLYSQMTQRPNVPHDPPQAEFPDQNNEAHFTLTFRDPNGEGQPDADAVILFLPKNKQIVRQMSLNGLLPDHQKPNHETIRQIEEMDGVYAKADAHGKFTFRYRAGIAYLLIAVSAHRKETAEAVPLQTSADLRRFFSDSETLRDYAVWAEELIWQNGTHYHKHTF